MPRRNYEAKIDQVLLGLRYTFFTSVDRSFVDDARPVLGVRAKRDLGRG